MTQKKIIVKFEKIFGLIGYFKLVEKYGNVYITAHLNV